MNAPDSIERAMEEAFRRAGVHRVVMAGKLNKGLILTPRRFWRFWAFDSASALISASNVLLTVALRC